MCVRRARSGWGRSRARALTVFLRRCARCGALVDAAKGNREEPPGADRGVEPLLLNNRDGAIRPLQPLFALQPVFLWLGLMCFVCGYLMNHQLLVYLFVRLC